MSVLRAAESRLQPVEQARARKGSAAAYATLFLTAGAALVLVLDGRTVLRPVVVMVFLAFVPGAAVVRLLGVTGFALRATLALAISLGLTGTVAAALAYLHLWSPLAVFVIVSVGTSSVALHELGLLAAAARQLARARAWLPLPRHQRRAVTPVADQRSRRSRLESELTHLVEVITLLDSVRLRAERDLDDVLDSREPPRGPITTELVIATVANHFGVGATELVGRSRSQRLLLPRQLAIYLSSTLTDGTTSEIGHVFGERAPSTVSTSLSKVTQLLREDSGMSALVLDLTDRIIQVRDANGAEAHDVRTAEPPRLEGATSTA
jgi:hypothetical protein